MKTRLDYLDSMLTLDNSEILMLFYCSSCIKYDLSNPRHIDGFSQDIITFISDNKVDKNSDDGKFLSRLLVELNGVEYEGNT